MKRKQVEINNIEKKDRFDYSVDEIVFNEERTSVNTFYNHLQDLFSSKAYKSELQHESQLDARRRALEIVFRKRVEFNIIQKLEYMQVYLAQYNINIQPIYGLEMEIFNTIPELFDLRFYFNIMTNPVSGFDYSVALNSILYNYLFSDVKYSVGDVNIRSIDEALECVNNFMRLALNEWMHMLNLLYLEANEIYYNAGAMKLDIEIEEGASGFLEGDERKQALIEMGRPDLIDTDIQVGKI